MDGWVAGWMYVVLHYLFICKYWYYAAALKRVTTPRLPLGLFTILLSPILYCVWHRKGGGRWGGVYCAFVVQSYCNTLGFSRGWGGNTKMIDSHNKALKGNNIL